MALRHVGRVAPDTRAKVISIAESLGYRGNAAAALLAKQRRPKSRALSLHIALVCSQTDVSEFEQCCAILGVRGTVVRTRRSAAPEEAARILWQRGVDGLLIEPGRDFWTAEQRTRFTWHKFPLVKIGDALPDLPCHLVRHDAFRYLDHTLGQAVHRGYRRLAVLLQRTVSDRDDDERFGALYNFAQRKLPSDGRLEWREAPLDFCAPLEPALFSWLRDFRPDAVVAYHTYLGLQVLRAGFEAPRDFGLCAVLRLDNPNGPDIAGCHVHMRDRYERPLALLLDQINQGERGFPARPMEHVIEPAWVEGVTLPKR